MDREVETVREVVIREEPRENIILEDELVAMMNDHFYGINSLIQRFETNREVAAMAENVAKMNGIRTAIRGGAHLDTVSDELSQELVKTEIRMPIMFRISKTLRMKVSIMNR